MAPESQVEISRAKTTNIYFRSIEIKNAL